MSKMSCVRKTNRAMFVPIWNALCWLVSPAARSVVLYTTMVGIVISIEAAVGMVIVTTIIPDPSGPIGNMSLFLALVSCLATIVVCMFTLLYAVELYVNCNSDNDE